MPKGIQLCASRLLCLHAKDCREREMCKGVSEQETLKRSNLELSNWQAGQHVNLFPRPWELSMSMWDSQFRPLSRKKVRDGLERGSCLSGVQRTTPWQRHSALRDLWYTTVTNLRSQSGRASLNSSVEFLGRNLDAAEINSKTSTDFYSEQVFISCFW